MRRISIVVLCVVSTLSACTQAMSPQSAPSDGPVEDPRGGGVLSDPPPVDPEQHARVCSRPNQDVIFKALCAQPAPKIDSMSALLSAIGLGRESERKVAGLGSSNALGTRHASPLNPAVVIVPNDAIQHGTQRIDLKRVRAVTYGRGEELVEMLAFDPASNDLSFYVLRFQKSCDADPKGCGAADLYTPEVERGWTGWTLYQDRDLANTSFDCLMCHQPAGPGTPKLLRMQEFEFPWMHWFPAGDPMPGRTPSEIVLQEYMAEMHGHEQEYAGVTLRELLVPTSLTSGETGAQSLNNFILSYWGARGGVPAPLVRTTGQDFAFPTAIVQTEERAGKRDFWNAAFAQVASGQRLPIPYYKDDPSDPEKRAAAVDSYLAVTTKGAAAETLLSPSDILSTEAQRAMSHVPGPDETPQELLQHFCGRCHNSRLDQTLSRARFNVDRIESLTAEQKQNAVSRLKQAPGSALLMPPRRFATLPDEALQRLVQFLQP